MSNSIANQQAIKDSADTIQKAAAEWAAAAVADKEYGGDMLTDSLVTAKKALDAFGTPELRTLLNDSRLGNHPEVIRFMVRAGKALLLEQDERTSRVVQAQVAESTPDPLADFCTWWLGNRVLHPPFDANVVTFDDQVVGSTLFREGPFQVQLFSVKPHTDIADHMHPNVDSFEVYLGGEIEFRHSGEYVTTTAHIGDMDGRCTLLGQTLRVKPEDSHGGRFGAMGGLFLSVQHWINGVPPSSVHLDWAFYDPARTKRNEGIEARAAREQEAKS
jgi:hypothetical protein